MATKLRFSRHGSKKNPFYWLVASDSRTARDSQFIEKLGTYNPLMSRDSGQRILFNKERIIYWLSQGAQPTEKAEKLFAIEGILIPFKSKKYRKPYESVARSDKRLSKKALQKLKDAESASASSEPSINDGNVSSEFPEAAAE